MGGGVAAIHCRRKRSGNIIMSGDGCTQDHALTTTTATSWELNVIHLYRQCLVLWVLVAGSSQLLFNNLYPFL